MYLNDSIRILVSGFHNLVRKSLVTLLGTIPGFVVAGEATGIDEALKSIDAVQPHVVLLDSEMDQAIRTTTELASSDSGIRVVILSVRSEWEYVREAIAAGASGVVLKESSKAELEMGVRSAAAGGMYLCAPVATHVTAFLRGGAEATHAGPRLTERQTQILTMLAEGLSVKEIAYALKLSPKTVETHRARLMERLEIYDIPTLVRYAVHRRLVKTDPCQKNP